MRFNQEYYKYIYLTDRQISIQQQNRRPSMFVDLYLIILPILIMLMVSSFIALKFILQYDIQRDDIEQQLQQQVTRCKTIRKYAAILQQQSVQYENKCQNTKFIKYLIFVVKNYSLLELCWVNKVHNKLLLLLQINTILVLSYTFPAIPYLSTCVAVVPIIYLLHQLWINHKKMKYLILQINDHTQSQKNAKHKPQKSQKKYFNTTTKIVDISLCIVCLTISFVICCLTYQNYSNLFLAQFAIAFWIGFGLQRSTRLLLLLISCGFLARMQVFQVFQEYQQIYSDHINMIKVQNNNQQYEQIVVNLCRLHKKIQRIYKLKLKAQSNRFQHRKNKINQPVNQINTTYLTEQSILNKIFKQHQKTQHFDHQHRTPTDIISLGLQSNRIQTKIKGQQKIEITKEFTLINQNQPTILSFNQVKTHQYKIQQNLHNNQGHNLMQISVEYVDQKNNKVETLQNISLHNKTKHKPQLQKDRPHNSINRYSGKHRYGNKQNNMLGHKPPIQHNQQLVMHVRDYSFNQNDVCEISPQQQFDTVQKYVNVDSTIYKQNWDIYEDVQLTISQSINSNVTHQYQYKNECKNYSKNYKNNQLKQSHINSSPRFQNSTYY